MKNFKILALFALVIALQPDLKSQISYSGNTISSTALYPSALGGSNTVNGNYAIVGGFQSQALGIYSFAFGYQCKALGASSIAIGAMAEATTTSSVVLGRHLKTTSTGGFIIGAGYDPSQLLINPVSNSLMIGFNSTLPTFFVSNSFGSAQTGKIGIGNITSPTAKLHVLADENEAAELRLEHRTSGTRQYSQIYFGTHTIRAGNAENMVFTTSAGKNFAFEEGNVGVGTTDPGSKLHVTGGDVFVEDINSGIIMKSPDGRCWRGTMTNEGVIAFSEIACPVGNGAAGQPKRPATDDVRIYPNPSSCGRFVVERPEAFAHAKVVVFSTDGRLVAEYELPDSMTLHTGILAAGTYVVSVIEQGRLVKSQQVVVE